MRTLTTLLLFLCCMQLSMQAQSSYKVGDKVNDFSLLNAINNSTVHLNDFLTKKAIVIIFTCNECPYSKLYEQRIMATARKYMDQNIQFLLINPNDPVASPDDVQKNMLKKAADNSYAFPYLVDDNQLIANLFGSTKTPEVFILKNINNQFIMKYRGAIDDNPQVDNDISQYYLIDALNAIVQNLTIKVTETRASGCMIKR